MMIRKKLTLNAAAKRMASITQEYLDHLPPTERARRLKAIQKLTAKANRTQSVSARASKRARAELAQARAESAHEKANRARDIAVDAQRNAEDAQEHADTLWQKLDDAKSNPPSGENS